MKVIINIKEINFKVFDVVFKIDLIVNHDSCADGNCKFENVEFKINKNLTKEKLLSRLKEKVKNYLYTKFVDFELFYDEIIII